MVSIFIYGFQLFKFIDTHSTDPTGFSDGFTIIAPQLALCVVLFIAYYVVDALVY